MSCISACIMLSLMAVNVIYALDTFYQPADGKCSDVHVVHNFSHRKLASGKWFDQYVSFGEEGDKCVTTHSVERGTTNYIDVFLYDKETQLYELFSDDLKYQTDHPGTYLSSHGATLYILAANDTSYAFGFQCIEVNGKTLVMVSFCTRERVMSDEEVKVYHNTNAKLEDKKLLPKMHKVSQEDCPPEYKLKILKDSL